jgi:hypothetical protein
MKNSDIGIFNTFSFTSGITSIFFFAESFDDLISISFSGSSYSSPSESEFSKHLFGLFRFVKNELELEFPIIIYKLY